MTATKKQTVYRIEDVSIVNDDHSKGIQKVYSGVIELNFKSVEDCHIVAKMANLERYNILQGLYEPESNWFYSNTAVYVFKDSEVARVEKERKNRVRETKTRKQKITQTILALPEERKVKESEHIRIVAEKRDIKLDENGIWDNYSHGRTGPSMIYRYVIYVKPTHVLKPGAKETSAYWAEDKDIVKNDKFIKHDRGWSTRTFDEYIIKCSSWTSPRRHDFYQLKKKKFADDMVEAILVRQTDRGNKELARKISIEAQALAELARDARLEIIKEGDELQKNWGSDKDIRS